MLGGCSAPTDEMMSSEEALRGREFEQGSILRVTANSLNVRSRGDSDARIVASLQRDDLVTVVSTSGSDGWVNIRTPDGEAGWSAGNYLTLEGDGPEDQEERPAVGDTCSPSRADGAVNRFEKALHDTIAFAEGTRADGPNDGYNVMFTHRRFTSCGRHPNTRICDGICSTAAGRYQFLYRTWSSISNTLGYATFEPENQERGAEYLIKTVRRANIPTDRPLTVTEFSNVMSKISYEWASLPPSRYPGQGGKSVNELRSLYCDLAGC